MNETDARMEGGKQALWSVLIGLCIGQFIMASLFSEGGIIQRMFWFIEFGLGNTLLAGIAILCTCGYFFGRIAGNEIITKKRNYIWVGCLCALVTLFTSAFISSLIGFFTEGDTSEEAVYDYIFKPMFWIMMFGFVPAVGVGAWFGKKLENK